MKLFTISVLLLLMLENHQYVRGQTLTLELGINMPIPNNSYVLITDIGDETIQESTPLICITTFSPCCQTPPHRHGEWYYPNRTMVPPSITGYDFYRTRGDDGTVRLNRRNNVMSPLGTFYCEIPFDNATNLETLTVQVTNETVITTTIEPTTEAATVTTEAPTTTEPSTIEMTSTNVLATTETSSRSGSGDELLSTTDSLTTMFENLTSTDDMPLGTDSNNQSEIITSTMEGPTELLTTETSTPAEELLTTEITTQSHITTEESTTSLQTTLSTTDEQSTGTITTQTPMTDDQSSATNEATQQITTNEPSQVTATNSITGADSSPQLFQLRLTGVSDCATWISTGNLDEKATDVVAALVSNIKELCQCNLTTNHISGGFRCFGESIDAVTYRGIVTGDGQTSTSDLISHIETWVSGNGLGPDVVVQSLILKVDSTCVVQISSLGEEECKPQDLTGSESPFPIVAVVGGAIGGLVVLVVLAIIIILVLMFRKRRGTEGVRRRHFKLSDNTPVLTRLSQPPVYEEIPINHLYSELPVSPRKEGAVAVTAMTNPACSSNGFEMPLKGAENSKTELLRDSSVTNLNMEKGKSNTSAKDMDEEYTVMNPCARRPSIPRNVSDALPPLPESFQVATDDHNVVLNPTYATTTTSFESHDDDQLKKSKTDPLPEYLQLIPTTPENPYFIANPSYEDFSMKLLEENSDDLKTTKKTDSVYNPNVAYGVAGSGLCQDSDEENDSDDYI